MPRFIYNASGLGIGGRITRPIDEYIDSQAACVLPTTGGRSTAKSDGIRLTHPQNGDLLLSFDSAQTTIEGEEKPGEMITTTITVAVYGLNVENVLKADEIWLRMKLDYDLASRRVAIDTDGSYFGNLTINGEPFAVTVDHGMARQAADYDEFRRIHPEIPEFQGETHFSLGRNPELKFTPYDCGYYDIANFGRIYFAEWTAAPDTQCISMMRMQLGSPQVGKLDVGGGKGNGVPFP